MFFTDDPVADFMRHDAEQERLLARLPKCQECGKPIQQEKVFVFGGRYYCDECIEEYYTVDVEDLLD